jgi:cystathionine beta-lyase/cystathionine gamma-synthase
MEENKEGKFHSKAQQSWEKLNNQQRNYICDRAIQKGKYTRTKSDSRNELNKYLCESYTTHDTVAQTALFGSGTNAIFSLIQVIVQNFQAPSTIVIGDDLYCDTTRSFEYFAELYPLITLIKVNVCQTNTIRNIFVEKGSEIIMFYVETCSNPSGQICDLKKVCALKEKFAPSCLIVVDNTWVSHESFNPLSIKGIDYVALSLTKHYACGDTIAGCVIGSKENMKSIIKYEKIAGIHLTVEQCSVILRNCKDMKKRLIASGSLAMEMAHWLNSHQNVTEIMYPMLESHPSYELAKEYLAHPPSCIWFHTKYTEEMAEKAGKLLKDTEIHWETSFGDKYCKIDNYWQFGASNDYEHAQWLETTSGVYGIWFRLSCGYDVDASKVEKIKETLNQFLSIIQ